MLYPNFGDHWDDRLFRQRIVEILASRTSADVLDLGAGAGNLEEMNFRGLARRVCGIDPDVRVLGNPFLDEPHVGRGEAMPFPDGSFDLVFANNVLEHLEDPLAVFREVARVLRPGGFFLAKTPNRWHYVPIVAQATPYCFHRWFNARRNRSEDDTYPTRYRANTPGSVRRLARASGLDVVNVELIEGRREYLRFNPLTYMLGALYERLVNGFGTLRWLRVLMVVTLRRPPAD